MEQLERAPGFWRDLWRLSAGYFLSEQKVAAWLLLLGGIFCSVLFTYLVLLLPARVMGNVVTALSAKDTGRFWATLPPAIILPLVVIAMVSLAQVLNVLLSLFWRRWLTRDLLRRYFTHRAYYQLKEFHNTMSFRMLFTLLLIGTSTLSRPSPTGQANSPTPQISEGELQAIRKINAAATDVTARLQAAISIKVQIADSTATKHYDNGGLLFDYDGRWNLDDQSTPDALRLMLNDKATDSQLIIIVLRQKITTKEQMEAVTHSFVEPSIASIEKQYEASGLSIQRTQTQAEIGESKAEGVRFQFTLDGKPGNTDINWVLLNKQLVVIFLTGPEKNSVQVTPLWNTIRQSLHVKDVSSSKSKKRS